MKLKGFQRGLRYGKLAAAGVLGRLPLGGAREAAERYTARKLLELRGVPAKISQILGITADEDGGELHRRSLAELEPLPVELMRKHLEATAPEFFAQLKKISGPGIAASLSQVHPVKLKDGRALACKILYPEIRSALDFDAGFMELAGKAFSSFKKGFRLDEYRTFIHEELLRELDLERESRHQRLLYDFFQERNPAIIIPRAVPELSGSGHLVMTWEDSEPLEVFLKKATTVERRQAADLLTEFYLASIFEAHMIHADPNPGNFGFRKRARQVELVVYDFGSSEELTPRRVLALLNLFRLNRENSGDLLAWYATLGFQTEALESVRTGLPAFTDLLFEPFLCPERYDLKRWNRKKRAEEILGAGRWNFMTAAPADFLPFMRAVQGLFYYIEKLEAGFFASRIIKDLLRKYDGPLRAEVPDTVRPGNDSSDMAAHLRILVMENGREKVSLSLPRSSIEELESIVDLDLEKKLREQNINTDDIIRKAREAGYRPMDLFKAELNNKIIHVFLK